MLPSIPSLNVAMPDAGSVLRSALSSAYPETTALATVNAPATAAAEIPATPFASLMSEAIGQVDKLSADAKSAVDGLMSGAGVDVHQAMIASEKAGMAFEMALAVRNKAVQAYQSVIGMQF